MKKWILALAATLGLTSFAMAAEFTVKDFNDDSGSYILMTGDVLPGDGDRLREAWYDSRIPSDGFYLLLHSPGGSNLGMQEVIDFVKDNKVQTVVPDGYKCYSACAEIWLAGDKRFVNGDFTLGFHVGSFEVSTMQRIVTADGYNGLQQAIQTVYSLSIDGYVENYELLEPYEFAWLVSKHGWDSKNFYEPTAAELHRLVGITEY